MKPHKIPLHRFLLISLLVLSMLIPGLSAFAQAADDGLTFTLSVEPASLTKPGTVTVSARVSNAGTSDLNTPMSLYDPDGKLVTAFSDGGSLLSLPSGENYLWSGQYEVKQSQLDDEKLVYTLRYSAQDASGNLIEKNLPATAQIKFTGEKVDLRVTRTITPEVVRRGKEVTVIYELVNQGNVKLNNITIRENRLLSTRTQTVKSLDPGTSEKITFTKNNVTADISSSALVTYRKEGDRKTQQLTIEAVDIPLAKPGLQYTLTSDKNQLSIGETATLTLTIKNAGNISYSNITVTDPVLGEVFTNVQIDAGQTKELTKEVTLNQSSTYAFSLKLEDNTGTTQTEKVPELKLSAYAEGQMLRLNLMLTASSETIHAMPGEITFNLTVTNDSNTPAKNIRIKHANTDIYTIKELAPGQSMVVSRVFALSQSGKYQFTASALDSMDNRVEFDSNALTISYAAPTAAPTHEIIVTIPPAVTHSPIPADYTASGGQTKDILFMLTLALGALFGLAVILLGISAIARANARAKSNAAFDTFELAGGARDYTAEPDEDTRAVETLVEEESDIVSSKVELDEEPPHKKYLQTDEDAEKPVKADEEQTPITVDEDGTFRLTRETQSTEDDTAVETERRSRRAERHKADETDETEKPEDI
ncbi:MAG: hypothetical protein GXZ04_07330 [Clostridiales bacterium]|nr:hypothetical protein [Clostridiales bacterium]